MPDPERTNPDGVDFGWVMQVTFIVTLAVGVPAVAVLSLSRPLPTWPERARFAIQVGAPIWFVTMLAAYAYARRSMG